jgi:drug/metabolite transporter (DMT)-like permease
MLISIVLSLFSALSYGFSDFLAARAAGRNGVVRTTAFVYVSATVVVAVSLLAVGGAWSSTAVLWGAIAGVLAIAGFLGFYAAMAAGPMSIVSVLISTVGSVLPVGVALLRGERLPPLAWMAVATAVAATVIISVHRSEHHVRVTPRTVLVCVLSGVGFGGSIAALDFTPSDSGVIPAFMEIATGLVALTAVVGIAASVPPLRRGLARLDPPTSHSSDLATRSATWMTVAGGALLGTGNALLALAMHSGALAVVSVIVGVYPLATIILARVVLKERLSPTQLGGVGLALAATAVLALTTG